MDTPLTQDRNASAPPKEPEGGPAIVNFRLDNGLDVVVIPDHRAPVATHMVWYRNGSADDPPGKSGIAHFLEHLMFKGTAAHPQGEFSKIVAELGGQENAFTGNDYTAYFQRVAKQHLAVMMEFEADRMTGLALADDVVAPERDVVLEERRMHCDADPGAQLGEAMQAALFTHHPYGTPIIGWAHEIEGLTRADALAYYQRFYTPQNAVLIVAGDVEADEVRRLAEATYGKIKPLGDAPQRLRPKEPPLLARRTVTVNDEKVEQPVWQRCYLTPSYRTGAPGEAEALEVLAHILGGGQTSLLYRVLTVEEKIAATVGAQYMGSALDDTRFFLYALPGPGVTLDQLEAAIDRVLRQFLVEGVDEATLERAKTRLVADAIYAQDSQAMLARWYGASLATGLSIDDVRKWPARIEAVDAAAVLAAATKHLDRRRAVTGLLLPEEQAAA
ncbi:MAG TPA: pitrilysin family protein [Roseiarcus sp.]|jgi:zinc protease|nr:pitrilysin family protein [Roseiarcus sp.]